LQAKNLKIRQKLCFKGGKKREEELIRIRIPTFPRRGGKLIAKKQEVWGEGGKRMDKKYRWKEKFLDQGICDTR